MTSSEHSIAEPSMRIGCLAWGSLVWEPRRLPLATGWMTGGPLLPIEFVRVGDHKELSTALCPGARPVPTRWAELRCASLEEAREKLREREEVPLLGAAQRIGSATGLRASGSPLVSPRTAFCGAEIAAWGTALGLHAVVWTALPPRVDGEEGRMPTGEEAVLYLRSLNGEALDHARSYVEQVAEEIRTPYRSRIEDELGWIAGRRAA